MTYMPDVVFWIDERVNTAIHGMAEKMSVHTGVKWQLQRTPYESEIDIVSEGRVLATVEAGEGQEKVAKILVAAPDMLEALNNIIEHCEYERYPSCGEILRIAKYALKGVQ